MNSIRCLIELILLHQDTPPVHCARELAPPQIQVQQDAVYPRYQSADISRHMCYHALPAQHHLREIGGQLGGWVAAQPQGRPGNTDYVE